MNNRSYNILFHTHTISGILISALLYIIFFAGSFSFFRDEIVNWERNDAVANTEDIHMDFDAAVDSLEENHNLYSRDISIGKYYVEQKVGVNLEGSKDSLADKADKNGQFFYLDTKTFEEEDYVSSYTLGEFLYRLHFFAQIPYPFGYYLSGFTAFFFLFAILTGIIIHWNKIISNFFTFRPWAKLKTLWTDAHTALGTLGLPFQFVYAVTGAFFMIKIVLVAPSVLLFYDGDQNKLYEDLGYGEPDFAFENRPLEADFSINDFVAKTKEDWEDFRVTHVHIFNFGDANMHVAVEGAVNPKTKFTAPGKEIFKVATGEVVSETDPFARASYLEGVKNSLYRLHFGDYGGYALKIVSFLLGIISCFVIISGVMIWLVARDKKHIPEKRRRFNEKVARIYLAVCLSMYPVTAAAFIAVKIFDPAGQLFIYKFYFITWLLISLLFILKKNHFFITKYALLSGSVLGFCIPLVNGLTTGNWIWKTYLDHQQNLFVIDFFWILLSSLTLYAALKVRQSTSKDAVRVKKSQKKEEHMSMVS